MKELSKITGKIRSIWKRLADPDYRDAYVAGKVANDVAFQVFYLREQRGWTQGELAHRAKTRQPAISRLERSVGSVNVGTLLKVARALNVGLSIRFVPFSRLVTEAVESELSAKIPDFDNDCAPLPIERITRFATVADNSLIRLSKAGITPALPLGELASVGTDHLFMAETQMSSFRGSIYGR